MKKEFRMIQNSQKRFRLSHFKAISLAIAQYEDLDVLLDHFVEGMCRTFNLKAASILLFDEYESQLFRVASHGMSDMYLSKGPLLMDEKDEALVRGLPVLINDMQNDPRVQYGEEAQNEGLVAMLSFPIKRSNTVVGLIRAYHSEPIVLDEEDIDSISVLSQLLGIVIENNGLKNFLSQVQMAMSSLPSRLREGK
jgi:signal transduction protein with GAF and PtsI domain